MGGTCFTITHAGYVTLVHNERESGACFCPACGPRPWAAEIGFVVVLDGGAGQLLCGTAVLCAGIYVFILQVYIRVLIADCIF